MKKQLQKGFTLIELMIVVAIIGILASIALPAYQTYVAKANITSIVSSAAAGKTAIWTSYVDNGVMPVAGTGPNQIQEVGSDTEGFYNIMTNGNLPGNAVGVYAQTATSASFAVPLSGINGNLAAATSVLTLTFTDSGGALEFTCAASTGTPSKYLPKNCTVS